jgi:hypothetical protein
VGAPNAVYLMYLIEVQRRLAANRPRCCRLRPKKRYAASLVAHLEQPDISHRALRDRSWGRNAMTRAAR